MASPYGKQIRLLGGPVPVVRPGGGQPRLIGHPIPVKRPVPKPPPIKPPPGAGGLHHAPGGGGKKPKTGGSKPPKAGPIRVASAMKALANVTLALKNGGLNQTQATHYAKILLTQPGVQIGPHSNIMYKGKTFRPDAFANSTLAKYVTGATAKATNQKAITTDPGYLQALASLGLARSDAINPLKDSERQAIIQFGDPALAGGDSVVAGAADVNPFSTIKLLGLQNTRNISNVNEASNRMGTYYGGGQVSGQNENQRQYAGNSQDAQIKMQNLLQQINQQIGSANQAYNVGQSGAQLDAYNNLLATGAIHAAHAPNLNPGQFHYNGFTPPPPVKV